MIGFAYLCRFVLILAVYFVPLASVPAYGDESASCVREGKPQAECECRDRAEANRSQCLKEAGFPTTGYDYEACNLMSMPWFFQCLREKNALWEEGEWGQLNRDMAMAVQSDDLNLPSRERFPDCAGLLVDADVLYRQTLAMDCRSRGINAPCLETGVNLLIKVFEVRSCLSRQYHQSF